MLSDAQIARFDTQGYLIVNDVVDAGLLDRLREEYESVLRVHYRNWHDQGLVSDPADGLDFWAMLDRAGAAGLEWFQPLDISLPHADITEQTPFHAGPAAFDLLTYKPILDIVQSLLGPELTSNPIQHVRIKPPQQHVATGEVRAHIAPTAWHQDRGVGLAEADQTEIVTVWIAVTDATTRNGCLQVIPNPPDDMYPHCPRAQTTIADDYIDTARAVPAEVPAGGIVLIHPLTPHSAGPNLSDGYRWSFDIRYNVTGQPTGRAQFPDFVARSACNPADELRDWRSWKEMWETARSVAASSPHIDQHRWQHDSPGCA
ncbi:phytanoyl-CoA dioxygenase family protein [Yoonia sp. SS1-5]|uniref:Phytanoyl-CoA dioxygenase family protein n=1 Tax=Yoonia rhodophyticola TaxID=3137370 RepID=A0AAN0MAX5_9RHOB